MKREREDRAALRLMIAMLWMMWLGAVGFACSAPAVKSALDVIGPIAADALSALIKDRYGSETDEATAGCFPIDEGFGADDDEGWTYILCRAKPVAE